MVMVHFYCELKSKIAMIICHLLWNNFTTLKKMITDTLFICRHPFQFTSIKMSSGNLIPESSDNESLNGAFIDIALGSDLDNLTDRESNQDMLDEMSEYESDGINVIINDIKKPQPCDVSTRRWLRWWLFLSRPLLSQNHVIGPPQRWLQWRWFPSRLIFSRNQPLPIQMGWL